jgi:multidrug efflux pump subunit AcrA (membrane-fusion protein)
MNKININSLSVVCLLCLMTMMSCKNNSAPAGEAESVVAQTPVQVSTINIGSLSDEIVLNATSAYLEKSYVKATTNGYIQDLNIQTGSTVKNNQLLFSLITKEARAIGNSINALDPGFKFSGISRIRAEKSGFVTQVNHQKGDYVQDGEAMAVISNQNSLVFLLDLPYEMNKVMGMNKSVEVTLPDGEQLKGQVTSALAAVDSLAQTQRMIIRVNANHPIPENLIGKVRVIKSAASNVQTLPKSAVLTNETEDVFWVMKLINDSTAVKTIIKKGMENDHSIQILSPVFGPSDRMITVGNYGLADTAKVKIVK